MADIVFSGQTAGGPIGPLPGNYDIVLYKGDYYELMLVLKDSTGTPINLTGYAAKSVMKTSYSDMESVPFTCTITAPTEGKVRLFMSSSVTSTLLPGSYIWDFQITSGIGETRTYLTGDAQIVNEVTT